MKHTVFADYNALSQGAVERVIAVLRVAPDGLYCFAGGDTPRETYRRLVSAARRGEVDLRRARFVGLDEWVGLSAAAPGSCRYFLDRELFKPLEIEPRQICFFEGTNPDLEFECQKATRFIDRHGPIRLAVLGIGVNGHLGFNEPGSSFASKARGVDLSATTQQVGQKYFATPRQLSQGVTLGLAQIRAAREVLLLANGPTKTAIIAELMRAGVSEQLPASLLRGHPQAQLLVDSVAAEGITT